jgi:hypothetical protein
VDFGHPPIIRIISRVILPLARSILRTFCLKSCSRSFRLNFGSTFERLRDIAVFSEFSVNEELGTLTWGNEIDIAPETLYADATGGNLPEWMESEKNVRANQRLDEGPHDGSRLPDR